MARLCRILLCLAAAMPALAQSRTRQDVAEILGFENGIPGENPAGWGAAPSGDVHIDDQVAHGGKYSARIDRSAGSSGYFSGVNATIPLDFAGAGIELRGFVKTENVTDAAVIWLREDNGNATVAFDSTQKLGVKGTSGWTEYSVSIPAGQHGKALWFGFFVAGTGKAWVDDLQLLVDGQPVAQAEPRQLPAIVTDRDFIAGSGIQARALSGVQIKNLATLAKVWGFLKYHHPAVTRGDRHWDYDLFRILPKVLAAGDSAASNAVLSDWIDGLGPVAECTWCVPKPNTVDLQIGPNSDWIDDQSILGAGLSGKLRAIHQNRTRWETTFYASFAFYRGNPLFTNELDYKQVGFPDTGYQLLALFRFWNMVQYFSPNRDIMADDQATAPGYWNNVLEEFIPEVALASNQPLYEQAMIKFIAKINDTHANLWSSLASRPPWGTCQLPVDIRFVEGRPLVLRQISTGISSSGLMPGDVIEQLDGVAVAELIDRWRPYYADSNEAARLRDIGNYMTHGNCGPADVTVQRGQTTLNVRTNRVLSSGLNFSATYTHDLAGNTFQKIADDIAYLKLGSAKSAQAADYIRAAEGTKGLIIDIRNYPSDAMVFSLGSLLVSEPTNFAIFTYADPANPGAFYWDTPVQLTPAEPHYQGKVVILVDEVTQSSAEYHTMAFRAAPGAIVIGSTTAGADGNVSTVPLPGGLSSWISGLGVFYPDRRPTQRIGIIPDIWVTPTIQGMRAGRDELLEEAVRQIRNPSPPPLPEHIRKPARDR